MIDLKEIQMTFQHYLMDTSKNKIVSHVISSVGLSAERRLSIYSDAYVSRLLEALSSNFPILKSCLGEDEFHTLGLAYINQYPSIYRSIRWYGDKLAEFIKNDDTYKLFYYTYEIAHLDWAMTIVFDAKDSSTISLEQMATVLPVQWGDMRFQFHPSVYTRLFKWNVVEFWQSTSNDNERIPLIKYPHPITWLFWRNNLNSHFSSISSDESAALEKAMNQFSFAEICETLCDFVDVDHVAEAAATMLKKWISLGLIAEIIL